MADRDLSGYRLGSWPAMFYCYGLRSFECRFCLLMTLIHIRRSGLGMWRRGGGRRNTYYLSGLVRVHLSYFFTCQLYRTKPMIIMRKAVASVVSGCTTGVPYTGTVYYSVLQNRAKTDVRNYETWKGFVTAPSV